MNTRRLDRTLLFFLGTHEDPFGKRDYSFSRYFSPRKGHWLGGKKDESDYILLYFDTMKYESVGRTLVLLFTSKCDFYRLDLCLSVLGTT